VPGRKVVLANNEIYHVFNRGHAFQPIFSSIKDYQRLINTFRYYRYSNPPVRLSKFLIIARDEREKILKEMEEKQKKIIEIYCFCLMPNHYHLLLKQIQDNGISQYMSKVQNSYGRFFNIKNNLIGSLFQGNFKAKRVETEEQLLHLSRYIHLNPFSSYVVKSIEELKEYSWSSLPDYLNNQNSSPVNKNLILGYFKNIKDYQQFVLDQAEYQRELENIKHLTWEND